MAEVLLRKSIPGQKIEDDVDIGLVYDDVTGQVVGFYGHNNTEDTVHLSLGIGARIERITLAPFTSVRQRVDLPQGRRVALRAATIADHPWQRGLGWVAGFDSITVERVYANPARNSPVVLSEALTEFVSSETTSHSTPMPATVDPGDLLDAGAYCTGTPTITASGFTLTGTQTNVSGSGTRLSLFARDAVGDEDGTNVDFVSSAASFMYVLIRRIEAGTWSGDVADIEAAFATGTSVTPDPPNLAPSGGSADYLWIAYGCKDASGTITSAPTDYTNLIAGTNNFGTARRTFEASSENPGTFGGANSEPYIAATEAVPPAAPVGEVVSLYPTADGTDTDVVDEGDATIDLFASIDDDPSSPNDADWNNNTDDAGQAFYLLTDMPSLFDVAVSATITVRYRGAAYDGTGTVTLYARLYQSDESTALSDEVQVAQVTADGSFANTSAVVLTGIVAGSKTVWDGARLRLRWERT
jgi:hypothetical protein